MPSAHHWLACSIASACVAARRSSTRTLSATQATAGAEVTAIGSGSSLRLLDVRPQDVAREQEPALHEVVGPLEPAVLVLDDDVAVVAHLPQRREALAPRRLAQP